jgi:hypothetical protein
MHAPPIRCDAIASLRTTIYHGTIEKDHPIICHTPQVELSDSERYRPNPGHSLTTPQEIIDVAPLPHDGPLCALGYIEWFTLSSVSDPQKTPGSVIGVWRIYPPV